MAAPEPTMKRETRTIIVLAVLFVGLAVALFVQQGGLSGDPTPTPPPTPIFQRLFPELEVLQIQAIRLLVPFTGDSFTITRLPDGTWSAPGVDGTLDTEAATLIARTVVLMPYRHSFTPPEDASLEQYGFLPEGNEFSILFITTEGQQHIISVGYPSQDEPTFYVSVDNRDELYMVERGPLEFLAGYFSEPPMLPE
jgi:hypothetical protein